jgi:sulfotransferase family protein
MRDGSPELLRNKQFVFIGGLHRSGTSLIHECLRDHPSVSGFNGTGVHEDEGQHLQTVYKPALEFGGPGKFGFDLSSFMDETNELVTDVSREQLLREWGKYWDLGRQILVEKSPPNLVRTRFLQALFPNSKFIIVLRHPVAVAYATKKWSHTSIPSLIEHSLQCYEQFLKDLPYLKSVYILRYEEFVASPQLTFDRITKFIGIDSIDLRREIKESINDKYFGRLESDCSKPILGWYLGRHLAHRERRANNFGYSLTKREVLRSAGIDGWHRRVLAT